MHPLQHDEQTTIHCETDILESRYIITSSGHKQLRYVIHTTIVIGKAAWPIELTLTNRKSMNFRLLLGRTALNNHVIIDHNQSFISSWDRKSSS